MSYQLVTRYCARCKTGTPHEYDDETEKGRCVLCADKSIRKQPELRFENFTDTVRHIAALDGAGNRGPESTAVTTRLAHRKDMP
jgi:hypothetical protein